MKVTNKVLLDSVTSLRKLNGLELPIKVAFLIHKNITEVEKELGNYTASRQRLIDQYTEKDEKGQPKVDEFNNYQFKDDCISKWQSDIAELLEIETELKLQPISISDLMDAHITITPSELASIEFLFKE